MSCDIQKTWTATTLRIWLFTTFSLNCFCGVIATVHGRREPLFSLKASFKALHAIKLDANRKPTPNTIAQLGTRACCEVRKMGPSRDTLGKDVVAGVFMSMSAALIEYRDSGDSKCKASISSSYWLAAGRA